MKYVPGGNSGTKKSLGQHWLSDDGMLQAIVEAGGVDEADTVLEIGPGLGTLTSKISDTGSKVVALEFDKDLLGGLQKKFGSNPNVEIIHGDVRTFDYSSMNPGYKIIANIPYYLTSNLIRSISEAVNPPSIAVLLIQKEVAERICALPGRMGILSVTAQFYFECSLDVEVSAEYFTPPPKVDSQVIVLKRRNGKMFDVDEESFFGLVKAGFAEKRKTLHNSLSRKLSIPKEDIGALLAAIGLKPTVRAQELSMDDWHKLFVEYTK